MGAKFDAKSIEILFGQFPFPQVVVLVQEDLEVINSREDLFRVVQSIRFCGMLKQFNFRVNVNCGAAAYVSFSCPVLERDSSQQIADCQAAVAYVRFPTTTRELLKELRNRLIFFLVHEVDEGILLGTNRIFDPHDPTKAIRDQQR